MIQSVPSFDLGSFRPFRFLQATFSSTVPNAILFPCPTSSPYRTFKFSRSFETSSTATTPSLKTSLSISVSPRVAIITWRKPPSAAGVPFWCKDNTAMAAKTRATPRQMLYGKTRFRRWLKIYVLRYSVVVTGTVSFQIPSDSAETVMLSRRAFKMSSAGLISLIGSKKYGSI
jgi:hypothetical protein